MHFIYKKDYSILMIMLTLVIFTTLSCSVKVDNKSDSQQVWIPWINQDGQYQTQKVQVDTVTNWSPLRGSAVNIRSNYRNGGKNGKASSSEVVIDYTTDSTGAIIPMTQFSVEISSIYAHFERLKKFDKTLGLIDADKTRNVYVKFRILDGSGNTEANNAFYFTVDDAFYILPYNQSKLPLSVNGAILAHEHFHSIFSRLILNPLADYGKTKNRDLYDRISNHDIQLFKREFKDNFVESTINPILNPFQLLNLNSISKLGIEKSVDLKIDENTLYKEKEFDADLFATYHLNRVFLMALNEGLADVWAWIYSGQSCFISYSLGLDFAMKYPEDLWALFNYIRSKSETTKAALYKNFKTDDHDTRCLKAQSSKLEKRTISQLLNKKSFYSFFNHMELRKSEFLEDERDVKTIVGYRLGTNLARLIYRRMEEQGDLRNPEKLKEWALHITKTLPLLLPKLKEVYIDGLKVKSLFPWEEAVDLLIFGEGSPSISQENCQGWKSVLENDPGTENFKKKCPNTLIENKK